MFKGKCIIFSAPSGSGKTTLVKYLLNQKELNLSFSISATTRQRRDGEVQGKDYFFKTKSDFKKLINNSEFLEHEEVYDDVFYGTLESEVIKQLETQNVIFDIDVIGGLSIKKEFPESTLTVFLCPPSLEELENRLRKRGTDSEGKIKIRLSKASKEMSMSMLYDYAIENHNLEETVAKVKTLINNFL